MKMNMDLSLTILLAFITIQESFQTDPKILISHWLSYKQLFFNFETKKLHTLVILILRFLMG